MITFGCSTPLLESTQQLLLKDDVRGLQRPFIHSATLDLCQRVARADRPLNTPCTRNGITIKSKITKSLKLYLSP